MAGKAIAFCKGQIAVRGQDQTTCLDHKRKTLDWFCETCHDVICVDCISSLHKGHGIVPLSETTPNNKLKIKTFINEKEHKELTQIQQEINSLSQLKHLEDENTEFLTIYKTELEKKIAELKDQLNQCKETLQNGTDIQVFDVTSRLHTDITLPRRPVHGTAKFSQSKHPNEALTFALGKMTSTSSGQTDDHVTAKVGTTAGSFNQQLTRPSAKLASPLSNILSEWDSPCDIRNICPASDDGIWACGVDERTLTHLTNNGTVQQKVKSHVRVTNFCMSLPTQKVWACSQEDNSVMELISGTDKFVHKFKTKDEPKCLCITKGDHALVGIKLGIIKYTTGGKPSPMTTSYPRKPLVRSPCKISECPVSENVAILDGDLRTDGGENEPLITVIDKHLKELYRYGQHQHRRRTGSLSFDPWDVTYDSLGHLVVADNYNNCLHLLSGDGHYLRLLHTEIDRPQAVCVDRQGVLWAAFGGMFGANKVKLLQYTSD